MVLQNNPLLLPIVKKIGCYFLSLARIVELEANIEFSESDINSVWNTAKTRVYINSENNITNPDKVLALFCALTGRDIVIYQVGEELNGKTVYWNWCIKAGYSDYDYAVEDRKTLGPEGHHFRLCNRDKNLIFDSYNFTTYNSTSIPRFLLYKRIK